MSKVSKSSTTKKDKDVKIDVKPEKVDKKEEKADVKETTTNKAPSKGKGKPRRKKNNMLAYPDTYDFDNLRFDEITEEQIPSKNKKGPALSYYRIPIYTKNPDGTEGDLIWMGEQGFSFGVQENTSPETGNPTGYSISYCMYDREGATPKQLKIVKQWDELANPLYWKIDETGKRMEDRGPTLYPRLMEQKAKTIENKKGEKEDIPGKILSVFYNEDDVDEEGNPVEIDALELVGKYAKIKPAIKLEGIYIGGTTISLQYKVQEADVQLQSAGNKRLLHRPDKQVKPEKIEKLLTKQGNPSEIMSEKKDSKEKASKEGKEKVEKEVKGKESKGKEKAKEKVKEPECEKDDEEEIDLEMDDD